MGKMAAGLLSFLEALTGPCFVHMGCRNETLHNRYIACYGCSQQKNGGRDRTNGATRDILATALSILRVKCKALYSKQYSLVAGTEKNTNACFRLRHDEHRLSSLTRESTKVRVIFSSSGSGARATCSNGSGLGVMPPRDPQRPCGYNAKAEFPRCILCHKGRISLLWTASVSYVSRSGGIVV